MKLKITVVAEYEVPDEFGSDGKQTIFHKDNPDALYRPDCFMTFQDVNPDENDVCENMSETLQSKIDSGFHQASWGIEIQQ